MRKSAAIILAAAAIVVFSSDAEARRLRLSLGKSSAPTPTAPVTKPAAAAAASNTQTRGGTFVYVSTNRNNQNNQPRPMAAAPQGPIPERGPLHEIAAAVDQMPPAAEKPVEQKPEAPAVRVAPVFISQAAPVAMPVERSAERIASAQPTKMVYCVKQANGACAPF